MCNLEPHYVDLSDLDCTEMIVSKVRSWRCFLKRTLCSHNVTMSILMLNVTFPALSLRQAIEIVDYSREDHGGDRFEMLHRCVRVTPFQIAPEILSFVTINGDL